MTAIKYLGETPLLYSFLNQLYPWLNVTQINILSTMLSLIEIDNKWVYLQEIYVHACIGVHRSTDIMHYLYI